MEYMRACTLDTLEEAKPITVELDGCRIALVRMGEAVHAVSERCSHAGGPLGKGWIEEGELVCPLHRWRFRLNDGRCTTVRGEWVSAFRCEIRGNEVWVEV